MTPDAARARLDVVASVGLLLLAVVAWIPGFVIAIVADAAFPAGLILLAVIAVGIVGTIILRALRRRAAWAGGATLAVVVLGWVVAIAVGSPGVR